MHELDRRGFMAAGAALLLSPLAACKPEVSGLKIGWQAPLATQGQIAAILQRTDILKRHDLAAEFLAFSFGTPQMEAARAGALDVALVGDQPLLNLIAAGADWKVLCRLFDTRVALFRNSRRPWKGPRSATFASPKGSVAHRELYYYQRAAGLNPDSDVSNVFLDAAEIGALLARGQWGDIDVIAIWEPLAARFEAAPGVVKLFERKTLGVVGVKGDFARDGERVKRLRAALTEAWQFFLANSRQANDWYNEISASRYPEAELEQIAKLDRNFGSGRPGIDLAPADLVELERALEWGAIFNPKAARPAIRTILV